MCNSSSGSASAEAAGNISVIMAEDIATSVQEHGIEEHLICRQAEPTTPTLQAAGDMAKECQDFSDFIPVYTVNAGPLPDPKAQCCQDKPVF